VSSESEQEHGYQTDFTSLPSDSSPEHDMQPDDVEDFRDREYPQLKGKTYLDHGGTTVRSLLIVRGRHAKYMTLTCTLAVRTIAY
jgi:molybdenum cofactor sulfurtransferase